MFVLSNKIVPCLKQIKHTFTSYQCRDTNEQKGSLYIIYSTALISKIEIKMGVWTSEDSSVEIKEDWKV